MSITSTKRISPTRDRLIDAAMELFYLQGYEATSVAEILEKANVNSGSLYHYFKSKDDLLLAVLDRYKEILWAEVIEPVFSRVTDPMERIYGILDGYRQGLLYTVFTGGCPIGNLALEVGDHYPPARTRIAESFDSWCAWIRKCLDEARERLPEKLDRDQLARFILTVMEGAVMQARAHGSIEPFDACVTQLRDYFGLLMAQATSAKASPSREPGTEKRQ